MDNDFIQWPAALFLRNLMNNTVIKLILFIFNKDIYIVHTLYKGVHRLLHIIVKQNLK